MSGLDEAAELTRLTVKLRLLLDLLGGVIVFSFYGLLAAGFWLVAFSLGPLISERGLWGAMLLFFALAAIMGGRMLYGLPLFKASWEEYPKKLRAGYGLVAALSFGFMYLLAPALAGGGYLGLPSTNWAPALAFALAYYYLAIERRRNTMHPYSLAPSHSTGIASILLLAVHVLGYWVYEAYGEGSASLFVLGGGALSYLAAMAHLLRRASLVYEKAP